MVVHDHPAGAMVEFAGFIGQIRYDGDEEITAEDLLVAEMDRQANSRNLS